LYVQNLVTLYFDPPFLFGQYFSMSASSSSISETLSLGMVPETGSWMNRKLAKLNYLAFTVKQSQSSFWKTDILIGNTPFTWRSITLDYENNARPGRVTDVLVSDNDSQSMTADFIPAIFPHSAHMCVNRSGRNNFSGQNRTKKN